MERLKQESIERGEGFWELRIGIHTGDVIAGVIGSKRIAYDVWGSTVNIAQRIETSGETWKVNVSESTYEQIFPYFQIGHWNLYLLNIYNLYQEYLKIYSYLILI